MKTSVLLLSFLSLNSLQAQKSLLPWSGAVCEKSGISCKEVDMELEGQNWISNVLPIGKKLEVSIEDPTGFVIENGQCFPGVSILVTKLNGDTLGYAPNIFPEGEGLEVSTLQNLSFSFSLEEDVKAGDLCKLDARFFDTKSSNFLQLKLDLILGTEDEKPVSDMIYSYSSSKGYRVNSTLEIADIKTRDTLIKNEKYEEFTLKGIHISKEELDQLNEKITIYSDSFSIIDPLKVKPEIRIERKTNPVYSDERCDLVVYVFKHKNLPTPAGYQWNLKLENNTRQQIIEILNPF
ncbi:MAG: hypothetical protein ACO1O6_13195 [Bacteroidota bacterium]